VTDVAKAYLGVKVKVERQKWKKRKVKRRKVKGESKKQIHQCKSITKK